MRAKVLRGMIVAAVVLGPGLLYAAAQNGEPAGGPGLPAQYSATAFGQSGTLAGKSFGMDVFINSWTSRQQVDEFVAALKSGGPDALVSAMEKTSDVGRLSPTGYIGNSFRFAQFQPTANGGSKIFMVTNRPMAFGELYNGTRSTTYPFGIIVLDVDKDGNGTGTLCVACKIKFNKKEQLEVENFGQKPLRLANVRRQK